VRKLCCYAAKFERAAKLNSLRGDWIAGYANLSAAGPKVVSVFFAASSSLAGRIAEEGKSREALEFIALRALLHRLESQLPKYIPKVRLFYCRGPSALLCQIKST
jgi:hypothetical protein